MTDGKSPTFEQERNAGYDLVLAKIQAHIDAVAPALILDINKLAPTSLQDSAEREAWTLLQDGIRHLRDGAPGGRPGSITEALSKTSLRNAALAAPLGVLRPQFMQLPFPVEYGTGFEAALFFSRRLVEAAQGDFSKSKQIIHQHIFSADLAAAFGVMPDATLKGSFEAAKPQAPQGTHALRKQMVMSFNLLADAYAAACTTLLDELSHVAPPAPKDAPHRPGKFSP